MMEKREALACSDPDSFGDDVILKDQFLYTLLLGENGGEREKLQLR
jgi:hypothetical protein